MDNGNGIPPGWTEDQFINATVEGVQSIPLQDCMYLKPRLIKDEDARSEALQRFLAAAKERDDERDRNFRVERGLPPEEPEQPDKDKFVEVVERQKLQEFGYLFFRLDYSDDARWEAWEEESNNEIQEALQDIAGIEYIADRQLNNPMVKDPVLDGKTVKDVYSLYPACEQEGYMSQGTVPTMCMAVDKEAMDSLLNPVDGQDPWVWGVDLTFNPETDDKFVDGKNEYPGYFKVAICALYPELYPMLKGQMMFPAEVWSFADPIWRSPI